MQEERNRSARAESEEERHARTGLRSVRPIWAHREGVWEVGSSIEDGNTRHVSVGMRKESGGRQYAPRKHTARARVQSPRAYICTGAYSGGQEQALLMWAFARGVCRCGRPCAPASTRRGVMDTCRSKAAATLSSPRSTALPRGTSEILCFIFIISYAYSVFVK